MRLLLLTAGLLLLAAPSRAQWLGSAEVESGYDDNMFRNYLGSASLSTDLTLMYGYFPSDGDWAANYTASLSTFADYPERQYFQHSLAASHAISWGEKDRSSLRFLGSGSMRIDRDAYTLYDYSQLLASVALRQQVTRSMPVLLSYRARYRRYPNFGELSYLEHFASLGSMTFFESRTSVRVQADLGYKSYLTQPAAAAERSGAFTSGGGDLTLDGGGPGDSGPGGMNGGGPGGMNGGGPGGMNGDASARMGMNGSGRMGGMEPTVEYLVYEEASTAQLRAWVNVGQSLAEGTGLSLRYLQRWNLTDRGRAFVGGAVDFIGEEELFDDPYSYESSELTLTLTQLLPWSMKLRAGGFYLDKTYDYAAQLDDGAAASAARSDARSGGWLRLEKRIAGDWLLFSGLELSVSYVHTRNTSNTAYYDYSSNAVGIGFGTDF